ncbi:MAG: hypothetical protein IKG86_00195 [Paludibacteraceae bacterium]|nr:hypothetical protein [Paludibacteraceae bacterium]
MTKKYQISLQEVQSFINSEFKYFVARAINPFNDNEKKIKDHLDKVFEDYKNGAILDGDSLQKLFFPTDLKQKYKIFISHSGKDSEDIKMLANVLENIYHLPCFVDWMVWGNIKKLQEKIDWELCRHAEKEDGGTTYSYADRNYTTAHTHAMLSMALLDMIDQCDICLFVSSKNSTLPEANFGDIKTLSPWIYEEISYMNHIAIRKSNMYSEGGAIQPIRISHPLDLSDFDTLTSKNLIATLKALND